MGVSHVDVMIRANGVLTVLIRSLAGFGHHKCVLIFLFFYLGFSMHDEQLINEARCIAYFQLPTYNMLI